MDMVTQPTPAPRLWYWTWWRIWAWEAPTQGRGRKGDSLATVGLRKCLTVPGTGGPPKQNYGTGGGNPNPGECQSVRASHKFLGNQVRGWVQNQEPHQHGGLTHTGGTDAEDDQCGWPRGIPQHLWTHSNSGGVTPGSVGICVDLLPHRAYSVNCKHCSSRRLSGLHQSEGRYLADAEYERWLQETEFGPNYHPL